jgi:pyrroline-5-carboxylate reductase
MKIGFLGVGTVSMAVIEAMATRGGDQDTIFLSPRGEKRSTELAAKYQHCVRLNSNPSSSARSWVIPQKVTSDENSYGELDDSCTF